jgi:hypothetical protein
MSKDNLNSQSDNFFVDLVSISQKLCEIFDKVDCLQRAVALVSGQQSDFKAEYAEDMTEVKRVLHELRHNKVWFPTEGF